MFSMARGQGALEYILMIAGVLLTVMVSVLIFRNQLSVAGQGVNQSAGIAGSLSCMPADAGAASSGLVGSWHLNENGGVAAVDSSGKGNTGAVTGGAWASGKFGGGYNPGGTGTIIVPSSASLNPAAGLTIEAWIYPTQFSGSWRRIVGKGYQQQYDLSLEDTAFPASAYFNLKISGTNYEVLCLDCLSLNTWYHLAATFDGTTMRLYVNGQLVDSGTHPGTMDTTSNPVGIGCGTSGSAQLIGTIDEVKIYSRALSQAEIQSDARCSPLPA